MRIGFTKNGVKIHGDDSNPGELCFPPACGKGPFTVVPLYRFEWTDGEKASLSSDLVRRRGRGVLLVVVNTEQQAWKGGGFIKSCYTFPGRHLRMHQLNFAQLQKSLKFDFYHNNKKKLHSETSHLYQLQLHVLSHGDRWLVSAANLRQWLPRVVCPSQSLASWLSAQISCSLGQGMCTWLPRVLYFLVFLWSYMSDGAKWLETPHSKED